MINMTIQNYCMVQNVTNICENVVVWDGNSGTWTPPPEYLMLVQSDTPAKIWAWDEANKTWDLIVRNGVGGIGFVWDGTYLTTNEPMPSITPN